MQRILQKNKEKLKADYFFVYGKNDFNELKKYINQNEG